MTLMSSPALLGEIVSLISHVVPFFSLSLLYFHQVYSLSNVVEVTRAKKVPLCFRIMHSSEKQRTSLQTTSIKFKQQHDHTQTQTETHPSGERSSFHNTKAFYHDTNISRQQDVGIDLVITDASRGTALRRLALILAIRTFGVGGLGRTAGSIRIVVVN